MSIRHRAFARHIRPGIVSLQLHMHHHLIWFAANSLIDMSIDDKPSVGLDIGRIGLWACGSVGPRVPSFPICATVRTGMPAGVKVKGGGSIDGHGT